MSLRLEAWRHKRERSSHNKLIIALHNVHKYLSLSEHLELLMKLVARR